MSTSISLAFVAVLEKIWRTPQSQSVLATRRGPEVRGVVERSTVVGDG